MNIALVVATVFTLLLLSSTTLAAAEVVPPTGNAVCGPREVITAQLTEKYQEHSSGIGISSSGTLLQVYMSVDGKTWTITQTSPEGLTCVALMGKDWQWTLSTEDTFFQKNIDFQRH